MKIAQPPGRTSRRGDSLRRRRVIGPIVLILALFLVGCGRQVPAYWPDLSVEGIAVESGTVYVTQLNGQVFALRADTGVEQWAYPAIEERSGGLLGGCAAPAPSDGPFYAAPTFDQENIYLGSAGEQTSGLFRAGENNAGLRVVNKVGAQHTLQWENKEATDRTVASPALSGTTIYLPSSDHNVYAIDIETRQVRWTFETGNWVWATPLVAEDRVYIASMDHTMYAVDDATGDQVWAFNKEPGALPATPAIDQGVLYFGSLAGHMYAVDAQSGQEIWDVETAGGMWATPLILDQEGVSALYFGTLDGTIYALNTEDGSELWVETVTGEVRGSPVHVDGTLYFGGGDGKLHAFDAQSGQTALSPLGQQLENASIYASPVYDGQQLYVIATNGEVFALDPEENRIVWQTNPLQRD